MHVSPLGCARGIPEPVEPGFQHLPVVLDPRGLVVKRRGPSLQVRTRPTFSVRHEPRVLEDLHVLLDAGEGHVEVGGELADRGVPAPEPLEDPAAGGSDSAAKAVSSRGEY